MRREELLRYWLPALIWAAILLWASGNVGSAGHTEAVLRSIVEIIVGPISDPAFETVHFIIRKSVHVLAYALAGALNFYAVRGRRRGWLLQWSALAVALAVLTASLDEWHQSFLNSRTGVPGDVVIDFCGAVLAQIAWRRVTNRRGESSAVSSRA